MVKNEIFKKIINIWENNWRFLFAFLKSHGLIFFQFIKLAGLLFISFHLDFKKENFTNGDIAIISLLIFLCVDIIIVLLKYLDKIKLNSIEILEPVKNTNKNLNELKEDSSNIFNSIQDLSKESLKFLEEIKLDSNNILNSISIQNPDNLPVFDDIVNAKECVFVSGTNMKFMGDERAKFIKIDSNVEIIFAISDIDNDNVKLFLKNSYGKEDEELKKYKERFLHDVEYINEERKSRGKSIVRIIYLDTFIPIAYHAIDYKNEKPGSSIIHAKHYLLSEKIGERTKAFNLSVHPHTKLYEKYSEQIQLIEKYGDDLSGRFAKSNGEVKCNKQMKNVEIFTEKADIYSKYRPNYSKELIHYLYSSIGMDANSHIADIGSGTGMFSKLLLDMGSTVYAIEPNTSMRLIADKTFVNNLRFHSMNSIGENTSLPQNSIDFITAAQSFHWFDIKYFKIECKRILKPNGRVVIIYNRKDKNAEINIQLAALIKRYYPEYKDVINHWELREDAIKTFFEHRYEFVEFKNDIVNNLEGFIGRVLSASFSKMDEDYVNELKLFFYKYSQDGIVHVPNDTIAYIGTI
jgi:ubiquinone/menaquinone biosynthesis C-methylase UbiE